MTSERHAESARHELSAEEPEKSSSWKYMQQARLTSPPIEEDFEQPDDTLSLYPYSARSQSHSQSSKLKPTITLPDMNEEDSMSESVQPSSKGITLDLTMSIGTPG